VKKRKRRAAPPVEAVLVETPLSGWEDMSSSTPLAQRKNIEPEFGGASRDRTDDLIVANDNVIGSSRLRFQSLNLFGCENHSDFVER